MTEAITREKEIILVDSAGNKKVTTTDQYVFRFNSGANISLNLNDQRAPEGIVFRAWYGEGQGKPNPEGSCVLVLNPSCGDLVWLRPFVLAGTSFADVKVKAASTEPPQFYSIVNHQEQRMPSDIKLIAIEDKKTGLVFEVKLPQVDVAEVFQGSFHIRTVNHGIVCEPKACNVWVFKHLVKNDM